MQSAPKHLTRGEELKLAGHVASVLDRLVVVAAAPGLPPMDEGSVLCVAAPPADADDDGGDGGDGDGGCDVDGSGGEGGDGDSGVRVLGCISEVFGPVSAPRYTVRFESSEAMAALNLTVGDDVHVAVGRAQARCCCGVPSTRRCCCGVPSTRRSCRGVPSTWRR